MFTSAIWKHPVSGPVWAGTLGLAGDAVANPRVHGGPDQALLMYAGAHYPVWEAEWGRDGLGPGGFGENLTVTELSEIVVCIGDVLEIGEATLQVGQPRQPCATVARRHGVRDLIAVVQRNGRSGWYLRVIREGALEAGKADPPAGAAVPRVDGAPGRARHAPAQRASRGGPRPGPLPRALPRLAGAAGEALAAELVSY